MIIDLNDVTFTNVLNPEEGGEVQEAHLPDDEHGKSLQQTLRCRLKQRKKLPTSSLYLHKPGHHVPSVSSSHG